MRPLRFTLPAINLAFFVLVALLFVNAHGVRGDVDLVGPGNDTVSSPADKGLLFFNRWKFEGDQESLLTHVFLTVNAPGFGLAKLVLAALNVFTGEFRGTYPFGLSYASYTLMLAIPLSLLQWFAIGLGLDLVRRRIRSIIALRI